MNKREPGPNDQYIEACLYYGKNRKEQFLNCIKECIQQELSEVDDNYQMNLTLRLWLFGYYIILERIMEIMRLNC